ncbi:MAG: RNA-binding transcriptional accessory protein [Bacteroidetes bacterium MedPE-SWsnd-G2]|nr:MAG: RNA-binding transcriptional accessory protein [Bacteroidetes bacterium MedPE-SWsnd-G2]
MSQITSFIAKHTTISNKAINATLKLLSEDCSIPFIARYRKELTGNLDEVALGEIVNFKTLFENLEKRKSSISSTLQEQGDLTPELKDKINNCESLVTLEDLYLPYKKKRKTKAEIARKQGLEPLAKIIMSQNADNLEQTAKRFLNTEIKTAETALVGARHIIAEWISERQDIRAMLRQNMERYALITTKVKSAQKTEEKAQKYRDYFDWSESLSRCPSHRLLAILRAETEGYIRLKIEVDQDRIVNKIESKIIRSHSDCATQIQLAIEDSFKRLLLPSISNEALQKAKAKADDQAILVFSKNLKQLLLAAPLGEKRILAIDPGFRTGCKVVCLDAQGNLKHNETIFPHAPKNDSIGAIKKISQLAEAYKIEAIAIGNGTASRETEQLIKKVHFKHDVEVYIVSEAGASIYSASKIARAEFPNYDVTVRGAVSIGRRLSDPLAELVKLDPKSIGVGQYQHDVDQAKLKGSLDRVVENSVNTVGVNINTASQYLLSYVSGIGPKLAENIIAYRTENGSFGSRAEIKKVPRLGEKAFQQSAGFLRIKDAKNPLDDSAVHPERYALVNQIAKDRNTDVAALIGNTAELSAINLEFYCNESIGLPTLKDILTELEKPGLDVRAKAKVFTFNKNIKTISDVQVGQVLPGIVNNITNFGCFVDIGIKESGLIHISNLADGFVSDVNAHVSLQEHVIVKVLEVDINRKRIQLSLKR